MNEEIHTVCMTVTHSLRNGGLALLNDECFGLVGRDPGFLYGIQGLQANHEFKSSDLCLGADGPQAFATLTLAIPDHPKAPLGVKDGPTLRVSDCKRMRAAHRAASRTALTEIVLEHHDHDAVAAVVGDTEREEDVLNLLTAAYPEHLPELMRSLGLHLGIFMMRTRNGVPTPMAMIDRQLVHSFVTDVETKDGQQAFSYRLADRNGNVRDIALPRRLRHSIAYPTTKGRRASFVPTLQMTIVTKMCEGNSVELDVLNGGGVGPGESWAAGATNHREAPLTLINSTIATAIHDHPFRTGVTTKTLLTLANPAELWPDISTRDNLQSILFFDPSMVSLKTLQALIDLINSIIDMYSYADRIRPVHKDPRKVFEALAIEYPLHVFDALEQTKIEVAVLPTRWKDGTLGLVTVVRKYCLRKYLQSIVTAGVQEPVRYVIDLDNDDMSPSWIEADTLPRLQGRRPPASRSDTGSGGRAATGLC